MSHYPILSYNGQSKHGICLYGHVHGNLAKNEIGKLYKQAKTLEITVEQFNRPATFKEIRNVFKDRQAISFDHHVQGILAP